MQVKSLSADAAEAHNVTLPPCLLVAQHSIAHVNNWELTLNCAPQLRKKVEVLQGKVSAVHFKVVAQAQAFRELPAIIPLTAAVCALASS